MLSKILISSVILIKVVSSQFQNVLITNQHYPNEVTISINPLNTNQIVAGSNIIYFGGDTSASGYYYTSNGGLNWGAGHIMSSFAYSSGDPVVLVDTGGNFYFLSLGSRKNSSVSSGIFCVKSVNGGINWSDGVLIGENEPTFQDKPWGCVDFSNSIYKNNIYVTWTRFSKLTNHTELDSTIIMFSRSTDGSNTWSNAVRLSKLKGNANDSSNTMEGAVPCTGPNGEIYVSWAGPKIMYQQYGIFFDKSTDGGSTWLDEDIYVTDQPGGWYIYIPGVMRCNGFPVICCDLSNGPYRGTIYINWSDKRNGTNDNDIWLIKSTNGGLNWSSIKRVNNDPPGKNQFLNWMSIDQTNGYLYITFYDQRSTTTSYANVYVARSTDGGETFENVKVNTNPVSNLYMLWDYIGISSYDNKVRPVWMGNNYSMFTAIIDSFYNIGIKNISTEIPQKYFLYQNYPNPFNPATKIRFSLLRPSEGGVNDVKLVIFDVLGREIASLIPPLRGGTEGLQPGTYEVEWDATNYPSGIYFYRLFTENYSDTKKMILIK